MERMPLKTKEITNNIKNGTSWKKCKILIFEWIEIYSDQINCPVYDFLIFFDLSFFLLLKKV